LDYFIKIDNTFMTPSENDHLNIKELYIYCYLYKEKNIEGVTNTSIALINDFINIKFTKRKDRNVEVIKATLTSLWLKEVIDITSVDGTEPKKFNSNDSLVITFTKNSNTGYTQLPIKKFKLFQYPSDLYIYSAVARWVNSTKHVKYSYFEWSQILKVSEKTAKNYVNAAIDRRIVYKDIGDYIDPSVNYQRVNKYSIEPFKKEEKSMSTKIWENGKANKAFRESFVIHSKKSFLNRTIEIFKTYTDDLGRQIYPDVSDFLYYFNIRNKLEQDNASVLETQFVVIAERRIEQLSNNPKFKENINEAIKLNKMGIDIDRIIQDLIDSKKGINDLDQIIQKTINNAAISYNDVAKFF